METELPDDIDLLKGMVAQYQATLKQQQAQMQQQQSQMKQQQTQLRTYAGQVVGYEREIERLKAQLDKLKRMLFGQSSEKVAHQTRERNPRSRKTTGRNGKQAE